MRAGLRADIEGFLREHGPATSTEVGLGVRARRADVDAVLASGDFDRLTGIPGASPRRTLFSVRDESGQAPKVSRGRQSRASLMLGVLRDGKWHSRRDLWEAAGRFFLTNNAAAELRRAGHNVVYDRTRDAYRLTPAAAMRAPRAATVSGSVAA